jgi:hypothetical protein
MEYDPTTPRLQTWEKPPELETRARWERENRQIIKGEKPKAILQYEVTRKKYVGDTPADAETVTTPAVATVIREVGLYAVEQTRTFRPTPRTEAIRALANIFLRYSSRQYYLWHCEGEWKSCNGHLSFERFQEHLAQKAIYGVRGNGRWTRFGGIDLDLHKGDRGIFLEQLTVLLEEFHGREGWHFQVADRDAQGVHLLQVLAERLDYDAYRASLRARLQAIDRKYPDLALRAKSAGMRSIGELEIFPNIKNGLRLIFCRGRTMLLDAPLPMMLVRGKYAVDVEKYIAWANNPTAYMPRRAVFEYIAARPAARIVAVVGQPVNSSDALGDARSPTPTTAGSAANNGRDSVKGAYARTIIEFWSGTVTSPKSLNRHILLLANIAPFYFTARAEAVSAIEEIIDSLDDISVSERLSSGNRSEISRVVNNTVNKAFGKSGSNAKLAATYAAWRQKGFNPFDKSTWSVSTGILKMGADFEWSPNEKAGLDQMQAILKTDASRTADFAKELLRIVAGHDGELAITLVERLLIKHGIKKGSNRDRKASKVMKLLVGLNWIVMVSECSWFPRQADKTQSPGLARRYGIGNGLQHKFVNGDPSYQREKEDMYPLLPHHVAQHILSDDDIAELALEQSRLKARISDVDRLSDEDRNALDAFMSPS